MTTKTVADKLLIKPNTTLWSSHPDRLGLLNPLPDGLSVVDAPAAATVALVFADDAAAIRDLIATHGDGLTEAATIWVAYPKGNRTDVNRDSLWPILAEHGLRPIGQVAVDDVWSALRFRPLQEGEAPFTGGKTR
jgi:hypothetical protein